ncbi:MAG: N-acetylneuraminate synthase [Myxococcales bacterium]|nr:N-acetylneuraminate synthase [Myxococcales bacterium]
MTRVEVIAEAGVNHNGDVELACRLVQAAARAGADTLKLQTFVPERVVSQHAELASYQRRTRGDRPGGQLQMLRELRLDEAGHRRVAACCRDEGIALLSTPFDAPSLAFLVDELDLPRLKLPSGELTNAQLLDAAARTQRALLISTGMATLDEVDAALRIVADGRGHGADRALADVTLLHCTSSYPAPVEQANLRALDTLRERFALPVGLSDHTPGDVVALAAAARGAVIIEKHLTLDRSLPGPDHGASMEPGELAELVGRLRDVERCLGDGIKRPQPCEADVMRAARRSVVAARPIARGEVFVRDALDCKRPAGGISPMQLSALLGRRATRDYQPDELIDRGDLP